MQEIPIILHLAQYPKDLLLYLASNKAIYSIISLFILLRWLTYQLYLDLRVMNPKYKLEIPMHLVAFHKQAKFYKDY